MNPKEAIQTLNDLGWNDSQIGRHISMDRASICRISRGKQNPSYEKAFSLIETARKKTKPPTK